MTVPTLRPVSTPTGETLWRRPQPRRPKLGQLLVDLGTLSSGDQLRTLAMQGRVEARYGDILIAHGLIDKTRLYDTIAGQYDTQRACLETEPPDIRLIDRIGVERCLTLGLLPWKRVRGITHVATSRPERFQAVREELAGHFGPLHMVIAPETDLHRAVLANHPRALAEKAETRVAADLSCRTWKTERFPLAAILLALACLAVLVFVPRFLLLTVTAWAVLTLVASTGLKIAAVLAQIIASRRHHGSAAPPHEPAIFRMPTVSIMVPLYEEREVVHRLIERLLKLTYPRELLDICLVVEADDAVTCGALDRMRLPGHIRQIVVPSSPLKTKPRALNYALDFCRGSIVGVYDAEDKPDPDQIHRVARRFHERGPDVACLQGVLDFYNARANWLSRCFTVEYATWFRVILPGLTRLGLVIPLGGTTLFFRRKVLDELGGWDAHNVTEDADLGVRLARHGYRTELIDTVTQEEANARVWPWIKQRSRWLKGYAVTWAVHMRNPRRLRAELGWWRFAGVQVLFMGTISQFLLAPFLWSFWLIPLGLGHPVSQIASPQTLIALAALFLTSEAINIGIGLYAVRTAGHRHLMPFVPTLHFYFPLAAVASYKGIAELLTRPFYWDKTVHGVFDEASDPAVEPQKPIPLLEPRRRRA